MGVPTDRPWRRKSGPRRSGARPIASVDPGRGGAVRPLPLPASSFDRPRTVHGEMATLRARRQTAVMTRPRAGLGKASVEPPDRVW
jgi:hypothetical protein